MAKVVIEQWSEKVYAKKIASTMEESFGLAKRLKNVKRVFIKPNLVSDIPKYIKNGSNTDIRIIEAVLKMLSKYPHIKVTLGESETGTKAKGRRLELALKNMGVYKLQKKYRFEILNMTHDKKVVVPIKGGRFIKKVTFSKRFIEQDLIINLPKLKTHKYSTITCALKNMFGVIPDPMRVIYHQNIHQVIADLNRLFLDKMFVITDGIICMEGQGPIYGNPIRLNTIVFSDNAILNDVTACKIMKIDYRKVKHIGLANEWAGLNLENFKLESAAKRPEAISRKAFTMATKNLFTKVEGFLMQSPFIVRILLSDFVRKNFTRRIRSVTDKLRGGSYSWYDDEMT